MSKGLALKLYQVVRPLSELTTAEILNWAGHIITAPRAWLPYLPKRPETPCTEFYFQLGLNN